MPLTFDKIISPSCDEPENFLGNEPDNKLYHYYRTKAKTTRDVYSEPDYADYENLTWSSPEDTDLTPREVEYIGIKTFPQIGAIGFYKLAYRDLSRVVAPVHRSKTKTSAPTLLVIQNASAKTLTFIITPPEEPEYECYRIVMACGYFSVDHITYELSITVPYPENAGIYQCVAIGYLNEGQICSEDSNVLTLDLPGNARNDGTAVSTVSDAAALAARITKLEQNGISASGQAAVLYGTDAPDDDIGSDGQLYVQWRYTPEE